jgi:DNA-binding beta-propeller fold protein YncE
MHQTVQLALKLPRLFRRFFGFVLLLALGPLSASAQNITFAGSFGSKGAGLGKFDLPVAVAVGPNGEIYVADFNNNHIQKFTESGAFVTEWYHLKPFCLTTDPQGSVYAGTQGSDLIYKYQSNGTLVWRTDFPGICKGTNPAGLLVLDPNNLLVASLHGVNDYNTQAGAGLMANYFGYYLRIQVYVRSIALSPQHVFYLFCQGSYQVQEYDAPNNLVRTWGGYGTANGEFRMDLDLPGGLALDSQGNVYVADTGNNRIQVFTANGKFLKSFGSAGKADGQFDHPAGLAFDPLNNNLYVADAVNNRIQRFLITPSASP